MSNLTSKRDANKKAMTELLHWVNEAGDNAQLFAARQALERLEAQYLEFANTHEDILAVTGPSEVDFQTIEFDDAARTYNEARARLDDLIAHLEASVADQTNGSTPPLKDSDRASTSSASPHQHPPQTKNSIGNQTPGNDEIIHTPKVHKFNQPGVVSQNAAHAIRRSCARSMLATEEDAPSMNELLAFYWSTYTAAVFGDSATEIGDEFGEIELAYIRAKRHLATIINARRLPAAQNNGAQGNQHNSDIKLPRIEIPKFAGSFQSWSAFHDLFSSMVDNAAHLNNVQKMHYLRSCVEGEAEHLIRSYKVTEANYQVAWSALKTRYNNKRLIINSHLEQLIKLPSAVNDSPATLRRQLDTFAEAVRALTALDLPTDQWDVFLVFHLVAKLDSDTKRAWEMSLINDEFPTFAQLSSFIERRCRSLEAAGLSTVASSMSKYNRSTSGGDARQAGPSRTPATSTTRTRVYATTTSKEPECGVCGGSHYSGSCAEFIRLNPGDRYRKARTANMCFNCLKTDHKTSSCQSGGCRKCGGRHHSLLHYDDRPTTAACVGRVNIGQVLLATATANIDDGIGNQHQVRIFLDSGSQLSFITERCAKRVGLARTKASVPLMGMSKVSVGNTRGMVEFNLQSSHGGSAIHHIQAFVMQYISGALPTSAVDKLRISFLARIPFLADPQFDRPGEVDILLGADVLGDVLLDEKLHDAHNPRLFARNTTLGWVIAGPIPHQQTCKLRPIVSLACQIELDTALQRFWELEALESHDPRTAEEVECEKHFASTHHRDHDGRYIVELPFRHNIPSLGNSRSAALKSLQHLERRFVKNPELRQQYTKFIDEYISLGHMSLITHDLDDARSFFLPHHPVFKPSSTTTKIRVVFDASRKTSTGVSLNDTLMVGPKLQSDLVDILLRFRSHAVAFCGDLEKMYRQIRTTPTSSEFQRILWRPSTNTEIRTYRLDTVTYGTASASYLATKSLQQLAIDEAHRFPLASAATLTDFYVDDLMTGCDNIDDALELQRQLIQLMTQGGFTLSKWASNTNALLESVPEDQREVSCPLEIHTDASIKTLGVSWNPSNDCFQYRVALPKSSAAPTKRIVLSEVASLFDPLGLLAPLIVGAKIYLQALWAEELAWDQPLPPHLLRRWIEYRDALPQINHINIPRWLGIHRANSQQLHGFSDASEAAYAAVVYLRATTPEHNTTVQLITARTKVAPLKKLSLPRLELCGATLLARLMAHVKNALNAPDIECHAWCDSTVTLAWIRRPAHVWHTFVANRVAAIQTRTDSNIWHHTPGNDNPADAASRGVTPHSLINSALWWHGPEWLSQDEDSWPRADVECITHIDEKPVVVNVIIVNDSLDILQRFSSLHRLQRVTAYMQRFAFNCRQTKSNRKTGSITTNELGDALRHWSRVTQAAAFATEIARCTSNSADAGKSKLGTLNPFLDEFGILRIGGRIGNARIAYNARHPIILPKACHLSELLVAAKHHRNLHSGPQLTIAALRQEYWILSARSIVKYYIHRCPVCIRHRHTRGQQLMAPLPERRTQPSRAFLSSGVDFAGPITIKLQPGRGTKTSKAYIALFVCFATRALHLELVSSLSSDAFLAAFRRFVARRGKCANLHSDCGTNFVGANKELRSLHAEVMKQFRSSSLADILATDGTQWHFNPPGAPSFGGIWEAGVKSTKHHLRRILGNSLLTFEEMCTTLAQIEATLNSRPICPMSDDARDLQALTPGHFLIGEPMNTVPDPIVPTHIPPLRRWHLLQQYTQHFWQRWRREYVVSLQERHKWTKRKENIKVGMLALIVDETLPPAKWTLGRVVELHPGADGLVRVVTLKHQCGTVKRPIVKLVIFPELSTHKTD